MAEKIKLSLIKQDNLILFSTFLQKVGIFFIEWTPHNGITLVQAITDPINRMITITEYALYTEFAIDRQLEDLINLSQFDPINRMISLTVIPLIDANCTNKKTILLMKQDN